MKQPDRECCDFLCPKMNRCLRHFGAYEPYPGAIYKTFRPYRVVGNDGSIMWLNCNHFVGMEHV